MPIDLAQAKAIFLAALEKDGPQRTAYLDAACAADTAVRQRVEAMLQAHEASGELLERSPAEMLSNSGDTEAEATAGLAADPVSPPPEGYAADPDEALAFLAPFSRPGTMGRLGHYHVQNVIGKGGFGIVFKAFDEKLHRVVAIKVLAPALATNAAARQRFIREARAAAAVSHEHVVAIHAIGDDHRPPFIVMQLVDGVSLQEKIRVKGQLELREILRIGSQTACGLAAAHKQGLVHRDIKPANILLENGIERVKITDFGLARATDDASITQSGTVAGTPMYMSPEQANAEAVDHRSDLFSLGSVLYAMCTGRAPFRASSSLAVLKRVCEETPTPIQQVNAEIPAWLAAIIAKLHAKKPDERFQSAGEVADLLGQQLAQVQQPSPGPMPLSPTTHLPVAPISGTATARRAARRRWEIALPIAGGVLMVAIVLMAKYWPRDDKAGVPVDPQLTVVAVADKDGWVQLFNGKDTSGWESLQPGTWNVKDNVLIGGGDRGFLAWPKKLQDFHCRVEAKIVMPGKASVNFRDAYSGTCAQACLDSPDADRQTGALALYRAPNSQTIGPWAKSRAAKEGWFVLEIIVVGSKATIKVDGDVTAERTIPELPERGFLQLEIFEKGPVVHFRKIEIKELPPMSSTACALRFDDDDRVEIATLKLPANGPYTMEGYFRPSKPGNVNTRALGISDQTYLQFTRLNQWRWVWSEAGKNMQSTAIPGAAHDFDRDHVACVNDGREHRLYVNGRLHARKPFDNPLAGKDRFEMGTMYQGLIEEVRISKTARYDAAFTPLKRFERDAEAIALYHFDEGEGKVLKDSSGNNHHGKIVGARWVKADGTPIPAP